MAIKRDLGISIGIFFIVIIGIAIWSTWSGNSREIESVANQFKPDSSWRLVSSRTEPPRNMCLGDTACPSIWRLWALQSPIENVDQFQKIATIDGNKMKILDECFYVATPEGKQPSSSCDASIIVHGYQIRLSLYGSEQPGEIGLTVEKAH